MNKEITKIRKKIDCLDKKLMSNLNKRFYLSKQIKKYKVKHALPTFDKEREQLILDKSNDYVTHEAIKATYKTILTESKRLQAKYLLIGGNLSCSFSDYIHEMFNNKGYIKKEYKDPIQLINEINNTGLNITNPYKKEFFNYCQKISEIAKATDVINVVTRKDNILYGDNLDVQSFINMINYYKIPIENSDIIILGNGATSRSVEYALKSLNARSIVKIVRTRKDISEIEYSSMPFNLKADIIINTTSHDVYPNFSDEALIDFNKILKVKYFIDVNYNPMRSKLYLDAERIGIKCYNGLLMLIENARLSESLWQNYEYDFSYSLEIIRRLINNQSNIILIGQTLAGKTTIGKDLAFFLQKDYIDLDQEIEKSIKLVINEDYNNLEEFRQEETNQCMKKSLLTNKVITLGAGAILNEKNIEWLKRNGIVIFLNHKLSTLVDRLEKNVRPLIKSIDDLQKMYDQRQPMYIKNCDIIIENIENLSTIEITKLIMEKIYEYNDNKWL